MAKKIQIDVEVNGKMQKATISAKKLRAALDGVEQGYQKAGASAGTYDRRTKGAAQATANGTKEFSKMSQGMGGLVGAYATVAASVFALSAAFNFLKNAADLSAQVKGQEMFAARTGVSMKLMTQNIQDATGGLVAFKEAAQAAAIGQAAGLNADQLERLGRVAKNAGTILGRDVTDSFNRLTRGAIKAEPELLDELGIIVRIKDASEEYAKVIGKSASDLTTFEKSQAVVNAVLEQGETKFQDVGASVNQVAAFGAKFRDTFKDMAGPIAEVSNFFAGAFKDSILAVSAVFGLLGVSILKSIGISGVVFKDMAAESKMARKRMKKYAGDETKSAIAGEIKKGNFTKRVISDIERASKSKTSKVINFSKVERAALQRDLQIIKAEFLQTAAAGETGFTRMITNWRAQLALFRAESGMVVGTFRALGAVAGRVFSKALSIAAFIGIAVMLVEIGKQFRQAFLISPALRKAERSTSDLTDSLKEQRDEITKIKNELKEATSGFNEMSQRLGIVANYNLGPLRGTLAALRKELDGITFNAETNQDRQFGPDQNQNYIRGRAQNILGDPDALKTVRQFSEAQQAANKELLDARAAFDKANEGLSPFKVGLNRIAAEFGALGDAQRKVDQLGVLGAEQGLFKVSDIEQFKVLQEYVNGLQEGMPALAANLADLSNAGISAGVSQEDLKAFNEELRNATSIYGSNSENAGKYQDAIEALSEKYPNLINQIGKGNERAAASKAAFGAITNAVRAFGDASDKFMPKESNFTAVYQAIDEIDNSIQTLVKNMDGVNAKDSLSKFLAGPGGDDEAASFRSALRLLNQIKSSNEDYVEITEESITLEGLRTKLAEERAKFAENEFILERKATQNKIDQIARLRSAASFEKDITSAKTAQEDATLALEKAETELLNKRALTLDLSPQQEQALQDAIDLARAELGIAQDKLDLEKELLPIKRAQAELSVDSKVLQTQKQINDGLMTEIRLRKEAMSIIESEARAQIQDAAGAMSFSRPFGNEQRFVAEQTLLLEEALVETKKQQAAAEFNNKVEAINLEYDLLEAKRIQTKLEMKALAIKLRSSGDADDLASAQKIDGIIGKLDTDMVFINERNRTAALNLAKLTYNAFVQNTERGVQNARRVVAELNPAKQIMEDAASAISKGLSDAITTLFRSLSDKTLDTGEKLKEIARGVLDTILQAVVQKGIVEPLLDQIGLGDDIGEKIEATLVEYLTNQESLLGEAATKLGTTIETSGTTAGTSVKTAIETGGQTVAANIQTALAQGVKVCCCAAPAPTPAGPTPPTAPTTPGTGEESPTIARQPDDVLERNTQSSINDAMFPSQQYDTSGSQTYADANNSLSQPSSFLDQSAITGPSLSMPSTGGAEGTTTGGVDGEGAGGGLAGAMSSLTEATLESGLQTASLVTGTAASLAALTGNTEMGERLAKVTAALQLIMTVMHLWQKGKALVTTLLNTKTEAANTTAVAALTTAVYADAATPLTKFGGIVSQGKLMPSYNDGGIGKGPKSGYMVEMHGTEAVVPLPNGKSIPVQLEGGMGSSQQNNVVVNVAINNDGTTEEETNQKNDATQMGKAISVAVQKEIQNQRRAGGMLSPYGAS